MGDATRDEMPALRPKILAMLAENPDAPLPGIPDSRTEHAERRSLRPRRRSSAPCSCGDRRTAPNSMRRTRRFSRSSHRLPPSRWKRETFRAAQDATRARDDLVAIVSHDLRIRWTPFTCRIVPARKSRRRMTARPGTSPASVISAVGRERTGLSGSVFDVARIEAGASLSIRFRSSEVADARGCRSGNAACICIEADCLCEPPTLSPGVRRIVRRVLQVFANLIGNAIKIHAQGRPHPASRLPENGEVRFTVSDTGPGIPPEHVDHVFDRYWQAKIHGELGAVLGCRLQRESSSH